MVRVHDVSVVEDLLDRVVSDAVSRDATRLTIVFPGSRPIHHFCKKYAALKRAPSRPPALFPLMEFFCHIAGILEEDILPETDAVFLLMQAVAECGDGDLQKLADHFSAFYPWGREIYRVIDELDRESVSDSRLKALASLEDYDTLRPSTQRFYDLLPEIRLRFHELLAEHSRYSPGTIYRNASERLGKSGWMDAAEIMFAGFFAFSGGEMDILKRLGEIADVSIYRHHDGRAWGPFREMEDGLSLNHNSQPLTVPSINMNLHAAPSAHGEVLRVNEILHESNLDPERTVIILPDPAPLLPLLWEVLSTLGVDYNITMGYPLVRTPIHALLNRILSVVETMKDERVYVPEYLKVMLHPYVKNFGKDLQDESGMRILIHSLEKEVRRRGSAFLGLLEIETMDAIYETTSQMMPETSGREKLQEALRGLHDLLIRRPQQARTISALARSLDGVVHELAEYSPAHCHPFFHNFFIQTSDTLAGLSSLLVADHAFDDRKMLHRIVRNQFSSDSVPFTGLPLRGLQVMGLLETRALRFDTVIILDVNEDILPSSSRHDPALPPAFRKALGLPGYTDRIEVYKYNFFRLLESAHTVHALYRETPDTTRSHFLEEMIFQAEKDKSEMGVVRVNNLSFRSGNAHERTPLVEKDEAVMTILKKMTFSAAALDTYLLCPMMFYFTFVLGLGEVEEVSEELDASKVGLSLHTVMRDLYYPHIRKKLTDEIYDEMMHRLPDVLRLHFAATGEGLLLQMLAQRRIHQLLRREKENFSNQTILLSVEKRLSGALDLNGVRVMCKGFLDRLDQRGQTLCILDYKSGRDVKKRIPAAKPKSPLIDRLSIFKEIKSFQLPLYAELVHQEYATPYDLIQAHLMSLRDVTSDLPPLFPEPDSAAAQMLEIYLPSLRLIYGEILNANKTFEPDPASSDTCAECSFKTLCRRSRAKTAEDFEQ